MKDTPENICIFCREQKEKFTDEHVFSATIGGAFVLTTVCADCNKILGDKIDNRLARHERILLHRHHFQIKRKGKSGTRNNIPNPFPGKHTDEDGNEHIVMFNEKGEARSKIIPKYDEPVQEENGIMMPYTISKEDFKDEETVKKRFAKKMGIDPEKVVIKDKKETPVKPITINVSTPNNPLILGALKVAYEFGVSFIPEYLDDPLSKEYTEILLTQKLREEQKILFDEDLDERVKIAERVVKIEGLNTFHHIAMLTTIKKKGLFCFVKIFDFAYLIKLSESDRYKLKNELWLFNDAVEQSWNMNIPAKLTHFNISVDFGQLNRKLRRAIAKLGQKSFKNKKGDVPVFDKSGRKIYKNLDELALSHQAEPRYYDHYNKQMNLPVNYEIGQYYLKFTNDNRLVPLVFVNYVYTLIY